jgi:hypothetical protein
MSKRHRRSKPHAPPPERARDLETVQIVNEVLSKSPVSSCARHEGCIVGWTGIGWQSAMPCWSPWMQVDLAQLRKLAAVRGLVNSHLRKRVWPLLLGINAASDDDGPIYTTIAAGTHRDTQVDAGNVQLVDCKCMRRILSAGFLLKQSVV